MVCCPVNSPGVIIDLGVIGSIYDIECAWTVCPISNGSICHVRYSPVCNSSIRYVWNVSICPIWNCSVCEVRSIVTNYSWVVGCWITTICPVCIIHSIIWRNICWVNCIILNSTINIHDISSFTISVVCSINDRSCVRYFLVSSPVNYPSIVTELGVIGSIYDLGWVWTAGPVSDSTICHFRNSPVCNSSIRYVWNNVSPILNCSVCDVRSKITNDTWVVSIVGWWITTASPVCVIIIHCTIWWKIRNTAWIKGIIESSAINIDFSIC